MSRHAPAILTVCYGVIRSRAVGSPGLCCQLFRATAFPGLNEYSCSRQGEATLYYSICGNSKTLTLLEPILADTRRRVRPFVFVGKNSLIFGMIEEQA